MTLTRKLALLAAILSAIATLASVWAMAQRIRAAPRRELFIFNPVGTPEFTFSGRPCTLTDVKDEHGNDAVRVTYGGASILIPATIPTRVPHLPTLVRNADWLRILRFAPRPSMPADEFERQLQAGQIEERLVIVTRSPPRGADPETWGRVWRKGWTFDFYEFLPEGGFRHERLGFPTSKRYQAPKPDELVEGTWQFHAALLTMPSGSAPSPRFAGDSVRSLSWTLAAASVSILALTVSITILLAPRGRATDPAGPPKID